MLAARPGAHDATAKDRATVARGRAYAIVGACLGQSPVVIGWGQVAIGVMASGATDRKDKGVLRGRDRSTPY